MKLNANGLIYTRRFVEELSGNILGNHVRQACKRMKNEMIIDEEGNKKWYQDDKLHREDGPAVERNDGSKKWFMNGKRHCENGPAIEYYDGTKLYYLEGKQVEASDVFH